MPLKGGLKTLKNAMWGIDEVEFAGQPVKVIKQVAWPHDNALAFRQATCRNSPTKRCEG